MLVKTMQNNGNNLLFQTHNPETLHQKNFIYVCLQIGKTVATTCDNNDPYNTELFF